MKEELSRYLYSRYKDVKTRYIMNVSADHATIITNSNYVRFGYKDSECKTIDYIDFEGGPMLSVGSEFNGKKIKSIEHAYLLTLE